MNLSQFLMQKSFGELKKLAGWVKRSVTHHIVFVGKNYHTHLARLDKSQERGENNYMEAG